MTLLCLHRQRCQAVVQDKEAALTSSQALIRPVPQSCVPAPSCAPQQGFAVLCQHCWAPRFPSLMPKYWFFMVRSECPENLILQLCSFSGASVKRCWNKPLFVPQMSCWCRVNKWAEMLKYYIFLQAASLGSLEFALHSVPAWGDFCILLWKAPRKCSWPASPDLFSFNMWHIYFPGTPLLQWW